MSASICGWRSWQAAPAAHPPQTPACPPAAAAVKGGTLYTCGYSVPSRPGHCLLFTTSYADAAGAAQRRLLDLVPRWLLHLYTQARGRGACWWAGGC
jgi:hypothetical protein